MTTDKQRYFVDYPLEKGYIHNWLVLGPHATPVKDMSQFQGDDYKLQILRDYHQDEAGVADKIVHFEPVMIGEVELRWQYVRTEDDHFVDLSTFYHVPHHLRAWASADIVASQNQDVDLVITTNGPADIWINGSHIGHIEHIHHQLPHSETVKASLDAGQNNILVRFETVAVREAPYVMALELQGFETDEVNPVRMPISVDQVDRYHQLEAFFDQAHIERDVYSHDDHITIRWAKGMTDTANFAARMISSQNRIYGELQENEHNGADRPMMRAYELPENDYILQFLPNAAEFYEWNVRMQRRLQFTAVKNKFSTVPEKTFVDRRFEALRDAGMRTPSLYTELAKMQGGWWTSLKSQAILDAIEGINQRRDCSDFDLVGLIGMLYRFEDHEDFPEEIKAPAKDCILNFRYWLDEPGDDAMCFNTENHSILFHTCEILAGQRYPDQIFSNSGLTGKQHQEKGERLARYWLQQRAEYGFQEWDSNTYFEHDLVALSHLLDMADAEDIWETAALIIDKIFITMALNSYKGVFGSTHGRSYTAQIKGGFLETTSGISRLMWGLGIYNHHLMGTISMACCENYQLPQIIVDLATDLPEEGMWSKERHAGTHNPEIEDGKSGQWEVNKVTYKTADYMLCSAQDYHPGETGYQQHIWQATMGPEAVVFVNHPACVSENGAHRPGFWHGNVILPRVAQWKDVLIAIHDIPASDWLGFTHAYFPRYAFDTYSMEDGWAFAQKDDGYLAITSSQGLRLITRGQNAYRELRSYGQQTVWVCQMGRAMEDGSFKDFKNKVLKASLSFDDLSVNYKSLRDEQVSFGWESDFLVNNEVQPLQGFNHYDGPHCAAEWPAKIMAVGYEKQLVRLTLAEPEDAVS
ncbi:MAG: hypothetical protein AAF629_03330 [Chloroflexota bacterium]